MVIGREARNVSEAIALDHVLGYTIANDVAARAFQPDRAADLDAGKASTRSARWGRRLSQLMKCRASMSLKCGRL